MERDRLVRRLLDAGPRPVVLLTAPAGYGKTSLLTEWAGREARPFAWVTLDAADNDPRALLSSVALALDAVEPIGSRAFEALASRRPEVEALALVCEALAAIATPFVLVLDDAHTLETREAHGVVKGLWQALPPGAQLAVASRTESGLPTGRLQVENASLELHAEDLAMTRSEGRALLSAAGVDVDADALDELLRQTDGWPAGLCLAALAAAANVDAPRKRLRLAADDRLMVRYVRQELLDELDPELASFLRRASVLDRLSAPLCDAVLERDDSAVLLDRLSRSNVLVRPLDRRGSAYRFTPLFAGVLRSELRRLEPGGERTLHLRTSAWLERSGDPTGAIRHAVLAGDPDEAGRLLWAGAPATGTGFEPATREWLARFSHAQVAASPLLALAGAGSALARGDLDEVQRLACLAGAAPARTAARGQRREIAAGIAVMRASAGRGGMARMAADAAKAAERLADGRSWRPLCRFLEGVARQLGGDVIAARSLLEEGAHSAAVSAPMVQVLCLAQLALLELEGGDAERAGALAARAQSQVYRCRLEHQPSLALVFAASALIHALEREARVAAPDLRRARGLLGRTIDPSPWYAVECRILLARAALRVDGAAAARAFLGATPAPLRSIPDAPVLLRWLTAAIAEVDAAVGVPAGSDLGLTAAEVRVLRYLPSHLSFREIAERLVVSPNTVKTHARGIYRKLDVTSRATAVDRAERAGLVDRNGAR